MPEQAKCRGSEANRSNVLFSARTRRRTCPPEELTPSLLELALSWQRVEREAAFAITGAVIGHDSLQEALSNPAEAERVYRLVRDRAMFGLMLVTGASVSELCSLVNVNYLSGRVGDDDEAEATLSLPGTRTERPATIEVPWVIADCLDACIRVLRAAPSQNYGIRVPLLPRSINDLRTPWPPHDAEAWFRGLPSNREGQLGPVIVARRRAQPFTTQSVRRAVARILMSRESIERMNLLWLEDAPDGPAQAVLALTRSPELAREIFGREVQDVDDPDLAWTLAAAASAAMMTLLNDVCADPTAWIYKQL